jgi:hypothetical protein
MDLVEGIEALCQRNLSLHSQCYSARGKECQRRKKLVKSIKKNCKECIVLFLMGEVSLYRISRTDRGYRSALSRKPLCFLSAIPHMVKSVKDGRN